MSNAQSTVLNWRGPLLSACIFAAVFSILLVMAHQNESKTSDEGSSLREDPYGTSLLFDSYARAGYKVERGQNEDSLSDLDAATTTAFFIGGRSSYDFIGAAGEQRADRFRERLENFLARGGRVVLIEPQWELKSQAQGWEVRQEWGKIAQESAASWVSPDSRVMPADVEMMYLAADAPWLQTDAQWITLYRGTAETNSKPDTSDHVYMAMRQAGHGELIVASQKWFLLNEVIKTHPNPALLEFLAGGRPVIWIDETLHGLHQDQGVLWLVQRYRLQPALLLFWAAFLALLWNMSGDLVQRPEQVTSGQIVRSGEVAAVAARRLLERSIAKERVVEECWEQFRRFRPQDAQAIAADPVWGGRLRTALGLSPLAGYKELCRVITERHESAKGLVRFRRDEPNSSK
jgi:hypothetical protein